MGRVVKRNPNQYWKDFAQVPQFIFFIGFYIELLFGVDEAGLIKSVIVKGLNMTYCDQN